MSDSSFLKDKNVEKVFKIAEGLLGNVTDILLFSIFFGFEASMAGYGKTYKAGPAANRDLSETNYKSIKRSLTNLKSKGLVGIIKNENQLFKITEAGKKRLFSIIPYYDSKRAWDNKLYMVTYDIPVKHNSRRNKLRGYLKKIGCASLQDSVWVTPYNPTKLIQEFVANNSMEGNLIIVSSIGKDGAVGGMTTQDLVESVYNLSEINEMYVNFIEWVQKEKPTRGMVISKYLLILKEDPQVPFELLQKDWRGEVAYRIFYSFWRDNNNKLNQ